MTCLEHMCDRNPENKYRVMERKQSILSNLTLGLLIDNYKQQAIVWRPCPKG